MKKEKIQLEFQRKKAFMQTFAITNHPCWYHIFEDGYQHKGYFYNKKNQRTPLMISQARPCDAIALTNKGFYAIEFKVCKRKTFNIEHSGLYRLRKSDNSTQARELLKISKFSTAQSWLVIWWTQFSRFTDHKINENFFKQKSFKFEEVK